MLPDHLYSSYKRYKADTSYVASWLTATAQRCGYISSARQEGSTSESRLPVLEEKAQKLAQEASQGSDRSDIQNARRHRIDIEEFVPLAEYIAKCRKLRVEDSETFASVLQDCIRARSRHLAHHQRSGNETGSSGENRRHDYFVRILQQVKDILEPLLPKSSATNQSGTSPYLASTSNIFENLSIDELSETTNHNERSHEIFEPEAPPYAINLGASEEEVRIATAMLFFDVHRLRDVIKRVWLLFQENKLDLMAASLATNTAIDFTRSIQFEFENTFPGQVDLNKEPCYHCAYLADQSASPRPLSCFETARFVLIQFKKVYLDDTSDFVPTVAPSNLALYDEVEVEGFPSIHSSYSSDLSLAMGVIPEFCVLIETSPFVQGEHELIRGLREVVNEKKEVFWATFALQVFLDMRNVVGEGVTRGFEQLLRESQTMARSIKAVLKLHQLPNPTLESNEKPLQQVIKLIEEWTESDFVGDCRNSKLANLLDSDHMERFHLLRRDPLFCGLLLYNFRMIAYEGAIRVTNSFRCIQAAAHLYNYLRQMKLLQQDWIDMEYVFAAHDRNEIFVGHPPSTATTCYKQIILASGVSARTFAVDRRPTDRLAGSSTNARRLQKRVPLSEVFKSRFCDYDGRHAFEPQHLETVLQHLWTGTAPRRQIRIGMCESLISLACMLHQEAQELSFDYFLLHNICWSMLSRLVDGLSHTNEQMRFYSSNPKYLPESVACLLSDAACTQARRPMEDMRTCADTLKRILHNVEGMASANQSITRRETSGDSDL